MPDVSRSVTIKGTVGFIKEAILKSQLHAARLVNCEMLGLYYTIGRYIAINSLKYSWGMGALKEISDQLKSELPGLRGFSETNLKNMRMFYNEWKSQLVSYAAVPNSSDASDEFVQLVNMTREKSDASDFFEKFISISFSQHIVILTALKDIGQRKLYIKFSAENHWSTRKLQQKIVENYAEHIAQLPSNFQQTIHTKIEAQKALNAFKDSYLLDFINVEELGVRDIEDIDERVVEKEIIHSIKKFIMTFGRDFAFVGNQYHLEAYSHNFFPDLLFFNRELNCLVVIELKTGKFKPSYLAQLMTYLRILDDKVRKPHENQSIGIVLCKDADRQFVEYVIQDYAKPMGVATYQTMDEMPAKLRRALPDIDSLKELL